MEQTSRGKFNRLQRATAEFTTSALDGYGLRDHLPARPAPYASYPVLVHRLASLLHAAFRPRLATTPWRFAITSPPSGCEGDLHPKAVKHARHTKNGPPAEAGGLSHFVLQTLAWVPLRLAVLVPAIHAAVAAGRCRRLRLWELDNQGFGGKEEAGDRGCVLECRAGHLGRVDDA